MMEDAGDWTAAADTVFAALRLASRPWPSDSLRLGGAEPGSAAVHVEAGAPVGLSAVKEHPAAEAPEAAGGAARGNKKARFAPSAVVRCGPKAPLILTIPQDEDINFWLTSAAAKVFLSAKL